MRQFILFRMGSVCMNMVCMIIVTLCEERNAEFSCLEALAG